MIPIQEAERIVHEELGSGYGVVKLSGYWVILVRPGFRALFDTTDQPVQSKSLPKAIRLAKAVIGEG